jgi:hypothetical protein
MYMDPENRPIQDAVVDATEAIFLTRAERGQLRREYTKIGDERVIRVLDQLDWLEERFSEAEREATKMQSRLRRRPSSQEQSEGTGEIAAN